MTTDLFDADGARRRPSWLPRAAAPAGRPAARRAALAAARLAGRAGRPRWPPPCRASCCGTGSGSPTTSTSCWPPRRPVGRPHRLVDAVLPVSEPDDPASSSTGSSGPDRPDAAARCWAVVRGHPGCVELRQTWRADGRREQRVVLVLGGERLRVLTGTLQRLLRAHGDRTPCVEVLPRDGELPAYHQAASSPRPSCGARAEAAGMADRSSAPPDRTTCCWPWPAGSTTTCWPGRASWSRSARTATPSS